jgi:hypothetical protein
MWHAPAIPDISSLIVKKTVKAITLDTLFTQVGSPPIDILVVDAEGSDAAILFQSRVRD